MIVLENIAGDESDDYLAVEYLTKLLQKSIYERLILSPYKKVDHLEVVNEEFKRIFKDLLPEVKDPQIQCTLKDDGRIHTTFLVPEWLADQMKEEGMLDSE